MSQRKIKKRALRGSGKFKDGRRIIKRGGDGSFPIEPGAPTHMGRVLDADTGSEGNFALQSFGGPLDLDRDLAEAANEDFADAQDRLWDIRAIFAFGKDENGQPCDRKQVGVFFMRPGAPTASEVQSVLESQAQVRARKLAEVKAQARRLAAKEYFVIEDDPVHTGLEVITRESLVDFILRHWQKDPIATMGNIQLYYEHVQVKLEREQLLHQSLREDLFEHVKDILELMDQQFKYDPWASKDEEGVLRRVDDKGVGPWAAKRN